MSQEIHDLINLLGKDKEQLMSSIESNVRNGVSNLGRKCLDVYQTSASGTVSYYAALPPSLNWASRFIAFCRGTRQNDMAVESIIPDTVNTEVTKAFLSYYESRSEEIAGLIANQLATSDLFVKSLAEAVTSSKVVDGAIAVARHSVNEKIKLLLVESLKNAATHSALAKTGAIASGVVTKVTASSIGPLVIKQLAILSKGIVAKLMASSAFKIMVAALVKKFAAAIVITVVSHFLWTLIGAKIAAAIGGAIIPFLTIAILGWVAYEIGHLSETLGNKISIELKYKLRGEVDKINEQVAIDIHQQIGTSIGALVAAMASDASFIDEISEAFVQST